MSSSFWRFVLSQRFRKAARISSVSWTPSVVTSLASGVVIGYILALSAEQPKRNQHRATSTYSHSLMDRNATIGNESSSNSNNNHSNTGDVFVVIAPPSVREDNTADVTKIFSEQCREIARYGLPSTTEVRCYGGYLASLNYERRIPNWVMEMIDYNSVRRNKNTRSHVEGHTSPRDVNADTANGDTTTSNNIYTKHKISNDSNQNENGITVSRKSSVFYADSTVPKPFRARPQDYSVSGYSRGHLAAAQLHMQSQEELDATFNINANIVPQDMTFNALDWQRLESLSRNIARDVCKNDASFGNKVYVISGPAFLPRWMRSFSRDLKANEADAISHTNKSNSNHSNNNDIQSQLGTLRGQIVDVPPNAPNARAVVQYELIQKPGRGMGIAIPTHLYKVILAQTNAHTDKPAYKVGAFLMPNEPNSDEKPLTNYQIDLATLEQLTGLIFFPHLIQKGMHVTDLCASYKCDTASKGIFRYYRDVAKLRLSQSIPELNSELAQINLKHNSGSATPNTAFTADKSVNLNETIASEYNRRKNELLQLAISSIDDL